MRPRHYFDLDNGYVEINFTKTSEAELSDLEGWFALIIRAERNRLKRDEKQKDSEPVGRSRERTL